MTGKWFSLVLFVSLGTLTCTNSEARPLQAIEYGSGLKAFCSASKSTDDRYAMCFAFVQGGTGSYWEQPDLRPARLRVPTLCERETSSRGDSHLVTASSRSTHRTGISRCREGARGHVLVQ